MTERYTEALFARWLIRELAKLVERWPEVATWAVAIIEQSATIGRMRGDIERLRKARENALNPLEHEQSR